MPGVWGRPLRVRDDRRPAAWSRGSQKTRPLARFAPDETPRSIQLYGTDPGSLGDAVSYLVEVEHVDHIDMNFGCPMGKVTRHGGGAALPWKRDLFRSIVRAAISMPGRCR